VIFLTSGNVHDCKVAKACLDAMPPSRDLLADKGYDSKDLRDWLQERGTNAVIPSRSNRKSPYPYDKTLYKQRNIIERMFCRLKDYRRIATRFDRNVKNFLSAICLAATVIWWI
jgi:transposase